MHQQQELLARIQSMVKAFPKQPDEGDWESLKESVDRVQQRLVGKGEYLARNFYEAVEFVPYTEDRLAYVTDIERVVQDQGLSAEEKEDEVGEIIIEYESYLARTLLYLGWTVGWCHHGCAFLLYEEVLDNVCRRCGPCPAETPEIEWRHPTETPPKMG